MLQSASSHEKRIMVVSSGFPNEKYPMAGIFEWDQAKALAAMGNQIIFVAIDLRSIRRWRKWGISHFIQNGVQVYQMCIPVGAVGTDLLDRIRIWAFERLFKRIEVRHGCPDVVHAHFIDLAVATEGLCKQRSIPYVITEHSSGMNSSKLSEKIKIRSGKAYATADKLLAVSSGLSRNIFLATGYKSECVQNIVDVHVFKYSQSDKKEHDGFTFVSTGGLKPIKGFDFLLDTFKDICLKYPFCDLIIYGDGEEREPLYNRILTLGIEDRVKFMGLSSRNQIAEGYRYADVFVLASRSETFGVAYIEAMAAGLPVIATRCGGPEDFVTPETGIITPVDDKQALYEAMEFMILHRDKYNSEFISKYASDHFSPLSIASQLDEIYNEVLRRRSK